MKQWPAWLMGLKMPHFDGRPGDVVWSFTLTNSIIMLLDGQSGKSLSAGAHGWNQQQSSLIKKKIVYAQRSSEYNYHTAFCFFLFCLSYFRFTPNFEYGRIFLHKKSLWIYYMYIFIFILYIWLFVFVRRMTHAGNRLRIILNSSQCLKPQYIYIFMLSNCQTCIYCKWFWLFIVLVWCICYACAPRRP